MSMQDTTLPDDNIRIVFRPNLQARKSSPQSRDGEWLVVPPVKPVSAGQTVVWHVMGASSFELLLPDIFAERSPLPVKTSYGFEATSQVRPEAPKDYYEYEAICDGVHARGGSAPGVIVD